MPRTGPRRSSLGPNMDSRRDGSSPAANVTPASVHCRLALLLTRWSNGEHHASSARTTAKTMSCPTPSLDGRRRGLRDSKHRCGPGVQQPQRDGCEAAQNAAPLCRLNDNEPTPSSSQPHTAAQPEAFLAMPFPTGPKLAGCVYWGVRRDRLEFRQRAFSQAVRLTTATFPRAHGVRRDWSCM